MIIRKADFRWESKIADFDTIGRRCDYKTILLENINNSSNLTALDGAVPRSEDRI